MLIIVNTATNCGLTKNNINELNALYEKFKDRPFQVLGFPSNSFNQELSCETDIKEFVNKNKIEWDYFGKVSVNGDNTEPLFQYLKATTAGFFGKFIKWNFTKFLVNKEGVAVKRYAPTDSPAVRNFLAPSFTINYRLVKMIFIRSSSELSSPPISHKFRLI